MRCIFTNRTTGMTPFSIGTIGTNGHQFDESYPFVYIGHVWKCWLFSQAIAWRIRKIISCFILTYITGERIENKQVLVNKSMPVVTSSGLQPGNVAFTIYLWFPHVILRPCELFLHIILTLYMNEKNHLIASLTHNSTEFHQALPQFEMFDTNSCTVSGKTAKYEETFGFVIKNLLFSVRCVFIKININITFQKPFL